ncbi:hypothetical protein [Corynebacterium aquilae]|uniref:hypothetical protein n=1 Tax=Corynebacterium aquilae TaxID=203263 RepID=UPI0012EE2541|nr:hypothetical protein [Corynebacterium aquilae]
MISAIGAYLVAKLNLRSAQDSDSTKRLELLIDSLQETVDRHQQTIQSMEQELAKLRQERDEDREQHHVTRMELETARLYQAYVMAEFARFRRYLRVNNLPWPPPDFLPFDEWREALPRDSP